VTIIVPYSAEWHLARRSVIGASEVAALFGVQADYQMSHYTLWQVKSGRIPEPGVDGERPRWGKMLEDAIGAAAAETYGWTIAPGRWLRDKHCALAATLDFEIVAPEPAVLETKNVDWIVHRRQWGAEPPIHVQLQHQAQLAVTGLANGYVCALVGGNHLERYEFAARPKIIDETRRRVDAFWKSVEEGREPPIDGSDSTAAAVKALFPESTDDEPADMTGDNALPQLCADMLNAAESRKAAEKTEQAAKSGILAKLGAHAKAKCEGFFISAADVKATPDKIITDEMVGQTIKGRAGYRRISVKELT